MSSNSTFSLLQRGGQKMLIVKSTIAMRTKTTAAFMMIMTWTEEETAFSFLFWQCISEAASIWLPACPPILTFDDTRTGNGKGMGKVNACSSNAIPIDVCIERDRSSCLKVASAEQRDKRNGKNEKRAANDRPSNDKWLKERIVYSMSVMCHPPAPLLLLSRSRRSGASLFTWWQQSWHWCHEFRLPNHAIVCQSRSQSCEGCCERRRRRRCNS